MTPAKRGRWVGPASSPCACSMLSMVSPQFAAGELPCIRQHRFDGRIPREVRLEQSYEVFIGLSDRPWIAVQVEESDGAHVAERLPERDVPIHLVGQRVPREADDRH